MHILQHVQFSWNNFRTISATEITLFQFHTWLHVKQNAEIVITQSNNSARGYIILQ